MSLTAKIPIVVTDNARIGFIRIQLLEIADFALDSVGNFQRQGGVEAVSTHMSYVDSQFETNEDLL